MTTSDKAQFCPTPGARARSAPPARVVCVGCSRSMRRQFSSPSILVKGEVKTFHAYCYQAWRVSEAMKIVDAHFPLRGPCFLCGPAHDARHRLLDAIVDRYRAGDSIAALAKDYDYPPIAIEALVDGWES